MGFASRARSLRAADVSKLERAGRHSVNFLALTGLYRPGWEPLSFV